MKKLYMPLFLLLFSVVSILNAQYRDRDRDRSPKNDRDNYSFRNNELIKGRGDNVYIIIDHKACWIPNMEVFKEMRLDLNAIRQIDDAKFKRIEMGSLIFRNQAGKYFVVLSGRLADVGPVSMFHALDLEERFVVNLPDRIISRFPIVRLVIGGRHDSNYIIEGRRIFEMRTDLVLKAFGLHPEDIVIVSDRVIDGFQKTPLLLKGRGDKIYFVEDGKCRWITSPESFRRNNFDMDMVMRVDERTIKDIPEGKPLN